jgi:hypothetical protein
MGKTSQKKYYWLEKKAKGLFTQPRVVCRSVHVAMMSNEKIAI